MDEKKSYRLGEYLITEYAGVLLTWERHIALAEQLSGNCFIQGDILIIGVCSRRETGYLIQEFHEHLKSSPAWGKTRYYCSASNLFDVATGQCLSNDFLEKNLSAIKSAGLKSDLKPEPVKFRLGQYLITVIGKNEFDWQKHEELNRIAGGRCFIESDILFIGPADYEKEGQNKQEFLREISHLPRWDRTLAWAHSNILNICREEQEPGKPVAPVRPQSVQVKQLKKEKTAAAPRNHFKEHFKNLALTFSGWLKTASHYKPKSKIFLKYLIPLLAVILLLALAIAFFSEKISDWSHGNKRHHHNHDDKHNHDESDKD